MIALNCIHHGTSGPKGHNAGGGPPRARTTSDVRRNTGGYPRVSTSRLLAGVFGAPTIGRLPAAFWLVASNSSLKHLV